MRIVRLEVVPPLTRAFGVKDSSRLVLEEEAEEGSTAGDLLKRLSTRYPRFREVAFAPGGQVLTSQVAIILNEHLVELQQVLETKVEDGDAIILLPAFAGG